MTEESKNIESLKDRIIAAARRGDISMRPRWHFVLKGLLVGVGALLALLALLYVASLIIFSLQQTGAWFGPTFGARGWVAFFRAMPWLLVGLSIGFIVILDLLVRRYSFAYRKSLVVTLAALLVVAVVGGIVAAPFHRAVFRMVRKGPPPPIVGFMYHDFGLQRFPEVHRGVLVGGFESSTSFPGPVRFFRMRDPVGEQWTVLVGPRTRLPYGAEFDTGDTVVVFGPEHNTLIDAAGVRELFDEPIEP